MVTRRPLVIMDDATSEIYYAQLVEEESTLTVMAHEHHFKAFARLRPLIEALQPA